MKVIIDKKIIEITPSDIKNLNPTFSLLHGRRFSYTRLKNMALNSLISAIINAATKSKQDTKEIGEFCKEFHVLKDKGYAAPNCQISKENFLTRITTKIKHFFSSIRRDNLLKQLSQLETSKTPMEKSKTPHDQLAECIDNGDVKNAENFLKIIPDTKKFINGKQYSDGSYDRVAYYLPLAIQKNNPEMVSLLLRFKADPNARGRISLPIVHAAKVGNLEIIKLLLANGAKLTECEDILFRGSTKEDYLDIVQCLIQNGADLNPDEDQSPLAFIAAKWDKNPDKVKSTLEIMLAKGAHFVSKDKSQFEGKIPQACLDFLKKSGVNFKNEQT